MKKFCPRKFKHHSADWYCEEEDCVWWDSEVGDCSIRSIATSLARIACACTRPGQTREDTQNEED